MAGLAARWRKPWPPPCPARSSSSACKDTFGASGEPEELADAFRHLARPSSPQAARGAHRRASEHMMSRFSLAGKNAVVTGGSRGIGARHCAGPGRSRRRCGAHLSREARRSGSCRATRSKRMGRRALALQMDVTDRASVEAAARSRRAPSARSRSWSTMPASTSRPISTRSTDADWDIDPRHQSQRPVHRARRPSCRC